ncbi:MAG TPA: TM2 domain-containing protein [Actinomycetaceae bacterium]|nr:TM2 domain-containing protein [Actinomycetaceae bacterium]
MNGGTPWRSSQPPRAPQPPPPPRPQPPPPQAWQAAPYAHYPGPGSQPATAYVAASRREPESNKSYVVTLLLSIFLGLWGVDRFYLGKSPSAAVKLFTFGGFGYWWIGDILYTLFGRQTDVYGRKLAGYEKHKKTVWRVIGWYFAVSFGIGAVAGLIAASFDSTGPTAVGWGLLATLLVGVAVAGAVLLRRRGHSTPAWIKRKADPVPASIRNLIDKLTELRGLYVVHAAAGNKHAASVIRQIDSLVANVTALFARLRSKATRAERGRVEDDYEDKLGKLVAALDRDYLLDVMANPQHWHEPEHRIEDMQHAIEEVDDELLERIRQLNAERGRRFQIPANMLIGPRKDQDDWQRDFDKASRSE